MFFLQWQDEAALRTKSGRLESRFAAYEVKQLAGQYEMDGFRENVLQRSIGDLRYVHQVAFNAAFPSSTSFSGL